MTKLNSQTDHEDVVELKEAIIELYLAIKIRSTEEVSTDGLRLSSNFNFFIAFFA